MSLPVAFVTVMPVPAELSFALRPVCDVLSLKAVMPAARLSGVLAGLPTVNAIDTAVELSDVTYKV